MNNSMVGYWDKFAHMYLIPCYKIRWPALTPLSRQLYLSNCNPPQIGLRTCVPIQSVKMKWRVVVHILYTCLIKFTVWTGSSFPATTFPPPSKLFDEVWLSGFNTTMRSRLESTPRKVSKSWHCKFVALGRDLFSREDIKAGELIFAIPQPLLNIVHPFPLCSLVTNNWQARAGSEADVCANLANTKSQVILLW